MIISSVRKYGCVEPSRAVVFSRDLPDDGEEETEVKKHGEGGVGDAWMREGEGRRKEGGISDER